MSLDITVMFDRNNLPGRGRIIIRVGPSTDEWISEMTVPDRVMFGPHSFPLPEPLLSFIPVLTSGNPTAPVETNEETIRNLMRETLAFGWNARLSLATQYLLHISDQPEMTNAMLLEAFAEDPDSGTPRVKFLLAYLEDMDRVEALIRVPNPVLTAFGLRELFCAVFRTGFFGCELFRWNY